VKGKNFASWTDLDFEELGYEKRHPSLDPDTFYIIGSIDPNNEFQNISLLDQIKIIYDDSTRFVGFVEKIEKAIKPEREYIKISGRCKKVILWKKWIERMERKGGFFGSVNPSQLIKLLLRCPVSDSLDGSSVFHRIGYGIDLNNVTFSATRSDPTTHPSWVKLRKSGFSWKLGSRTYSGKKTVSLFTWEEDQWIEQGTGDLLDTDDGDTSYIEGDDVGDYESVFKIQDLPSYIKRGTVSYCKIYLKGKYVHVSGSGGESVTVRVYVRIGDSGSWQNLGTVTWDSNDTDYIYTHVDAESVIQTVSDFNNMQVRLKFDSKSWSGTSEPDIRPRITYLYVDVVATQPAYQTVDDEFCLNFDTAQNNVVGVLFECRENTDCYPRKFKVQVKESDAASWETVYQQTTTNTIRDVLVIFGPKTVKQLRIVITENVDKCWQISQIFVFRAETTYKVLGSGTYELKDSFSYINDYGEAIKPISFSFMRLSEALNNIVKQTHQNYKPWELWIDYDDYIHFASSRGSDVSGTVEFQEGIHFSAIKKAIFCRDSYQRAWFVGRSEGKEQEEQSSEWQTDTDAINDLGTFYEKIISGKTVSDSEQANVLAQIELELNKNPITLVEVDITNDEYIKDYDVGDTIGISSSTTGITGTYRVTAIRRTVKGGEIKTKLTLSTSFREITDELTSLIRRVRELELAGGTLGDWVGEGKNQEKISAEKQEETINITASKVKEKTAPADKNDPDWEEDGFTHGQEWNANDDWFYIKGHNEIDACYECTVYIKRPQTISFKKNPYFEIEVLIPSDADLWYYKSSSSYDYAYIRMFNGSNKGFGIFLKQGTGQIEAYAVLNDAGGNQCVQLSDSILYDKLYKFSCEVKWEERIIEFRMDGDLKAVLAFDSSETGSGTNMYPLYVSFHNCSGETEANRPELQIARFKARWNIKEAS